jgi:hypothetical protein
MFLAARQRLRDTDGVRRRECRCGLSFVRFEMNQIGGAINALKVMRRKPEAPAEGAKNKARPVAALGINLYPRRARPPN